MACSLREGVFFELRLLTLAFFSFVYVFRGRWEVWNEIQSSDFTPPALRAPGF